MSMTQLMTDLSAWLNAVYNPALVLLISAVACVFSLMAVSRSHLKTRSLHQQLKRLEHDLKVANGSAIGMGQQLIALEKQISQQASQQPATESPADMDDTSVVSTTGDDRFTDSLSQFALDEQSPAENSNSDDSSATSIYDDARRALAKGNSIADVAKQCGLSYAEVSLLQALTKQSTIS